MKDMFEGGVMRRLQVICVLVAAVEMIEGWPGLIDGNCRVISVTAWLAGLENRSCVKFHYRYVNGKSGW